MSDDKSDADLDQFKTALGLYVEDPWERVKFIFTKNSYGEYHPDLSQTLQTTYTAFLVGVAVGGAIHQKKFLLDLKERSDASVFYDRNDANRYFSRQSLKGFIKGAFKWGPRMAIFTGGFSLFASCVEAYRNKPGIIEYSIGGATVGGLLRTNFGIRGALVGGLVGMILGTIYGISYFTFCKISNKDSVQIKYGQYSYIKYLKEKRAEKIAEFENYELRKNQPDAAYINPLDDLADDEEPVSSKTEENLKK